MEDLSLGPLRIANPDDASPDNLLQPQASQSSAPAISPLTTDDRGDYLTTKIPRTDSPVSPMEGVPMNSAQAAAAAAMSTSQMSPQRLSLADRNKKGHNIPYTYQDQQQAQFPQYQSQSRPSSQYYTQVPVNGSSTTGVSRKSSYRQPSDTPTHNPSRRVSQRSTAGLDSTGIPARDDGHTDRSYIAAQFASGNGPVPPRRTSRTANTMTPGRVSSSGNTPLTGTPISNTNVLSSSPYNIEGGPLSSSEDWQERGAAIGVKQEVDENGRTVLKSIKKGVKDFNFGRTLGEGSYSTVLAAKDRQTGKDYAIKVLDKRHIIKEKKVKYVNIEKDTLNRLTDHPGVVRLYYTFQDERSLYFVLDLCSGGELLGVLKRTGTFDEECTRFYGAQILDTVEYMHSKGVIHRDLKPENVLLDDNRFIKITDFGTAKLLGARQDSNGQLFYEHDASANQDRASSFVGTAEYVSPELLTDKNACKASDLWAFGCIIYQLLAGRPPFKAGNEYQTFQKIVALNYDFPRGFPDAARDLVERLLVLDPQRRLTIEHIKNHPFFEGITWGRDFWQQKAPRLKPYVPPPNPPIKLNGAREGFTTNDYSSINTPGHSAHPTMLPPVPPPKPPQPRVITELPPPSQLDIEWSPVLTRNNERILKLGNLSVLSSQYPHSPNHDGGGKFSRFFGGGGNKKRQRLVMVTSSARIIIAEAGGESKKSKSEIGLLSPGTEVTSQTDSRGTTQWVVNTRDKQFVFEDSKPSSADPMATAVAAQEWIDALDKAKEIAHFQQPQNTLFGNDDELTRVSSSALSSHTSTMDQATDLTPAQPSHGHRGILQKQHSSGGDTESLRGRKRFSKRQSKSGLTAVF